MSLRSKNPQEAQAKCFCNKVDKLECAVTLDTNQTNNLVDFSSNPLIINENDQVEFSDEKKLQSGAVCLILVERL